MVLICVANLCPQMATSLIPFFDIKSRINFLGFFFVKKYVKNSYNFVFFPIDNIKKYIYTQRKFKDIFIKDISIYSNASIIRRLKLIDKLDDSSSSVTREDLNEIALSISDFINNNRVHPIERASMGLLEESFDFTEAKAFLVNPKKFPYCSLGTIAYDFNSATNNNLKVFEVVEILFNRCPSKFRKHLVCAFFENNQMIIFGDFKNVDLKNKEEIRLNYELIMFNFN